MADFKSEWPRSNRNQWPTSFRDRRPTSSGICKYIERGLEPPSYGPPTPAAAAWAVRGEYLRSGLSPIPASPAAGLLREIGELGYAGGYTAVTDFLREVRPALVPPFEVCFETMPGEQAQVNFAHFEVILPTSPARWGKSGARLQPADLVALCRRCYVARWPLLQPWAVPRQILYDWMKTVVIGEDDQTHIVYNRALIEPLGLAVGARRVRLGADVAQPECRRLAASGGCDRPSRCRSSPARRGRRGRRTRRARARETAPRSPCVRRAAFHCRPDFAAGQARGVVDADVHIFPAGAARAVAAIAGDPVPDRLDTAELFDIDVDQLTRPLALVAHRRRLRRQRRQSAEPEAAQHLAHGRGRHAQLACDGWAGQALSPQLLDLRDPRLGGPVRERCGAELRSLSAGSPPDR